MAEQFGDKTHDATPFRRQQAREQGQVARSQDLASAALLMGGLAALLYFGRNFADFFATLAHRQLGGRAWIQADSDFAIQQSYAIGTHLGRVVLPLFGLLVVVAAASHLAQTGFLFLPNKAGFDFSRVSPWKGIQRLLSLSNTVRLGFGIFKIAVIGIVAAWSLWSEHETILALASFDVPQIAVFVTEVTLWTCLKIALALLILAIIDYAFQRWKYEQDLRMTDREVRDEMKSLQGDPQIIARRRAIQRQLVMNRVGSAVPGADVVVTNPTELAVALKYDIHEMEAPVVVAKGAGVLAQRIRRLALEHSIPVVERKELARALYKDVDVGSTIPAQQYAAVAEVLRYVYQLQGRTMPDLDPAA